MSMEGINENLKFDKFEELAKDKFFNDLTQEECSIKDYSYLEELWPWQEFGLQNLGELCDLYVKTHVLLLADIIRKYREQCLRNFDLDPVHY